MASSTIVFALVGRDRASSVFRQVGRSANSLASTSSKVGRAIKTSLAVGAVGVAGIAVASLKTAGDFEKSMNRVKAVSQATGKDFTMLRDQAKEMGRTTAFSAKEAADAQGNLAMAGLSTKQVFKALPSVINLASTEQMGLADAASIATNVMTGYGKTVDDLAHVTDVLAKASINTNAGVSSIGEAMKYAAPVAHQAGLKFEETTAAIGLMSNAGIQGSMAGTALRGAISRLLKPTKQVQAALDHLGVKVSDSHGKLLPLRDIVDQLGKKGATAGDLLTIFGQRAGPGMTKLVALGAPALDKLRVQLENSGGTAEKVAKIQLAGLQGQLKRLKGAWEDLLIEVGDTGLLSGATKAVTGLTTATSGFASWINQKGIPAAQNFGHTLAGMIPVAQIQDRVGQAKQVIGDFWGGLTGSKPAKAAKDLMGGLLDTSPHLGSSKTTVAPKGPALAPMPHYGVGQVAPTTGVKGPALAPMPHGGSGSVAPLVTPKVKPPKSLALRIGEQVRLAFTGGIKGVDWGKVGAAMGNGLASGVKTLAKGAVKLTAAFGHLMTQIDWVGIGISLGKFAIPLVTGFVVGLLNVDLGALLKGLGDHWFDVLIAVVTVAFLPAKWVGAIGKMLTKIPFLGKLISWAFEIFAKFSKSLGGFAGKVLGGFAKGFVSGIARVFPEMAAKLSSGLASFAVGIVAYVGRFGESGLRLVRGIVPGMVRGAAEVGTAAGRVIGTIVKPFASAGRWLLVRGFELAKGFGSGIVTGAQGLGSLGKAWIVDPVVGVFKTAGSWLLARGSALVSGFKSGMVTGAKAIGSFGKTWIIDPVVGAFKTSGSWLWARGSALVSGFKNGIVAGAKFLGTWVIKNVVNPSVGAFAKAGSWLLDKGGALISGLKSGIVSGIKGIGSWIKSNIIDPVVNAVKNFFGIHSPSTVFAEIGGHLVGGLFKGLATTNGTDIAKKVFGDMPSALGSIVKKGIVSVAGLPGKALNALGSLGGKLGGFFKGLFGGGDGGSVGKGVQRWAPLVSQVLSMLGAPATAIGPVLKRINTESGGNPNAINNWDINAKNGDPSRGLMQTIGSTFAAYAGPFLKRGIYDPLASIYAGINYAMHRYGANWINVMTRPGGYAKGTMSAAPGLAWVGEKGPELMNLKGGESILSHRKSMAAVAAGVSTRRVVIPSPASTFDTQQAAAVRELAAAVHESSASGGQFVGELRLDSGELMGMIQGTVRPMIKSGLSEAAYRAKVGRQP
ncbi:phage tail tape measure protein [Streptomyces sp. NPDC051677]|uniref:phage tail tape measure protein n=1 Tax=Streptomyces sp. NPDC051677 TaxID=3365669 RepID=UPI0037D17FBD